ncbi:MAG: hypothetical protein AVDCRST_MAG73-764, partial [uncultured Thermomicrobiales bacterium]
DRTRRHLPDVFFDRLRVLDVRVAGPGPAGPGRRDTPPRARGRRLRRPARPGHRGGAGRHPLAPRRPRRGVRLLGARSLHRGDEPQPDPADLGSVPLRLPRRRRPVRPGVRRALRGLRPRRGGVRGPPRPGSALLHPDQRDHLLRLHGRG